MTNKTAGTRNSTVIKPNSPTPENEDSAEPRTEEGEPTTEDSNGGQAESPTTDNGRHEDGAPTDSDRQRGRRSISIRIRSLVVAVIIVVLAGAVGTLAWLYIGAEDKLDSQASQSANNARAETVALDYAVNAATMDFKDLQAWKVKLVAGTGPQLHDKLTAAAASMEQILVPLEWTSTAKPLVAKVRSNAGGIYVVDCFVSVQTKTVQAPDLLQSTATYSVTIDSNQNWVITDVGGIGSVVEPK
jgi:hypothetical protein